MQKTEADLEYPYWSFEYWFNKFNVVVKTLAIAPFDIGSLTEIIVSVLTKQPSIKI